MISLKQSFCFQPSLKAEQMMSDPQHLSGLLRQGILQRVFEQDYTAQIKAYIEAMAGGIQPNNKSISFFFISNQINRTFTFLS